MADERTPDEPINEHDPVGQPDDGAGAAESPSSDPRADDGVDVDALAEEALAAANEAVSQLQDDATASTQDGGVDLPEFDSSANGAKDPEGIGMLGDVELRVKIELGRTVMYVEDVLRLNELSIVELDKAAGDPVDVYVNNRLVARGEVLVLNDNFCVRVSEIIHRNTPATAESASPG